MVTVEERKEGKVMTKAIEAARRKMSCVVYCTAKEENRVPQQQAPFRTLLSPEVFSKSMELKWNVKV